MQNVARSVCDINRHESRASDLLRRFALREQGTKVTAAAVPTADRASTLQKRPRKLLLKCGYTTATVKIAADYESLSVLIILVPICQF